MEDFLKKALSADTPVMKRIVKFKRQSPVEIEMKKVGTGIPLTVILLGGFIPVVWLALRIADVDLSDDYDIGWILGIVWLFLWPLTVAFLLSIFYMFFPKIRRYNQCIRIQSALVNTKGVTKPASKEENFEQLKEISRSFDLDGLSKEDNKRFYLIYGIIVLVSLPIQYWVLAQ